MEFKFVISLLLILTVGVNSKKLPLGEFRPYVMRFSLEFKEDKIADFVAESLFATNGWITSKGPYCDVKLFDVFSVIPFKKTSAVDFNAAIDKLGIQLDDDEINNFVQNLDYTELSSMGFSVSSMYKNFVKTYMALAPTRIMDVLNVLGIGPEFAVAYTFGTEDEMFKALQKANFSLATLSEIETIINVKLTLKDLVKIFGLKKIDHLYFQQFFNVNLTNYLGAKNIQVTNFVNFLNSFMLEVDDFKDMKSFKTCYKTLSQDVTLGVAVSGYEVITNDDTIFQTHKALEDFTTFTISAVQTKTPYPITEVISPQNETNPFFTFEIGVPLPQYIEVATTIENIATKMCTYVTVGLKKLMEHPVSARIVDDKLQITKTLATPFKKGSPLICEGILYGLAASETMFTITFDTFGNEEKLPVADTTENRNQIMQAITNLFQQLNLNPCNYFSCSPSVGIPNEGIVVAPPIELETDAVNEDENEAVSKENAENIAFEEYEEQSAEVEDENEFQESTNEEVNPEITNQAPILPQDIQVEIKENEVLVAGENEDVNKEGVINEENVGAQTIVEQQEGAQNQVIINDQTVAEDQVPADNQVVENQEVADNLVPVGDQTVVDPVGEQIVGDQAVLGDQEVLDTVANPAGDQVVGEQIPVEDQVAAEGQTLAGDQTVIHDQTLVKDQAVVGDQSVVQDQAAVDNPVVVGDQTVIDIVANPVGDQVVGEHVVIGNQAVVEGQAAAKEQIPVEDQAAIEGQIVAGDQTVVDIVANPVGDQIVVEGQAVVEEQIPVEDQAAIEGQIVTGDQTVHDQTLVEDQAVVGDQAVVQDQAAVDDPVVVGDQTVIDIVANPVGDQVVGEPVVIGDQAVVEDQAAVEGQIVVGDEAVIHDQITMGDQTLLKDQAVVDEQTIVDVVANPIGDQVIGEPAVIGDQAVVEGQAVAGEQIVVEDQAAVEGTIVAGDEAVTHDQTIVKDQTLVEDQALVEGEAAVDNLVAVGDQTVVDPVANPADNQVVGEPAVIGDQAVVEEQAAVDNPVATDDQTVVDHVANPVNDQAVGEPVVIGDQAVVEEQAVLEQQAVAEEQTAAENQAPVEGQTVVEDQAIIQGQVIVGDQPLVEDQVLVEDQAIVNDKVVDGQPPQNAGNPLSETGATIDETVNPVNNEEVIAETQNIGDETVKDNLIEGVQVVTV